MSQRGQVYLPPRPPSWLCLQEAAERAGGAAASGLHHARGTRRERGEIGDYFSLEYPVFCPVLMIMLKKW